MISKKIFMVFFAAVFLFAQAGANAAQVPQTINFQGYLTDPGGNPLSVTKIFSFALYNAPTGGTALWTENQTVTATRGIYNVVLGNTTPINLAFDVQYYLGVKVDVDPEMTPRQPLLTTGYSFRAQVANSVDSSATANIVPVGSVMAFAGTTVPSGWLLCNGLAVSRTTYPALFTAIGTTYGTGDGTTTFNVPDTRGYFLRGMVDTSTLTRDPDSAARTNVAGTVVGAAIGSLQTDQFASHTHDTSGLGGVNAVGAAVYNVATAVYYHFSAAPVSGSTGGNETRPKNLYVNYIIKY